MDLLFKKVTPKELKGFLYKAEIVSVLLNSDHLE